MSDKIKHVCPFEKAGSLDNRFRRWIQNPRRILKPYIREGMTVLDLGCGPGFFTVDMARMVGKSGKVIATDLQEEMLQKLRDKIKGTEFEERITLIRNEENEIGVSEEVDFVLLFYVVHEVLDKEALFRDLNTLLKQDGRILIVEPPFHVSKAAFAETVNNAKQFGFTDSKGPRLPFNKTAILQKIG